MKSLLEKETYTEIISRIQKLSPESPRQWGTMDAAQMLWHLTFPLKIALTDKDLPNAWIGRLFGWYMKKKYLANEPMQKNLPTAKVAKSKGVPRNFEEEKAKVISLIDAFYAGKIRTKPHPLFGKLSKEEWGRMQWKHLDHHLRQFGV